jgi:hypothetical protein
MHLSQEYSIIPRTDSFMALEIGLAEYDVDQESEYDPEQETNGDDVLVPILVRHRDQFVGCDVSHHPGCEG